jgi:hypothetical protein
VTELLKLLRDAIGIRPLVPAILVLLAALLFKSIREYPIRELLHDRWFLLVSLAIVSVAAAHGILTSGLADRTRAGRLGVYVARLKNDPAGKLHLRLLEGLRANLDLKTEDSPLPVEVRDLRREIGSDDESVAKAISPRLNATIIIWGTAIDDISLYPRIWVRPGQTLRSHTPLNVTDLSALAEYSATIWTQAMTVANQDHEWAKGPVDLGEEVARLRIEVAELRNQVRTGVEQIDGVLSTPGRMGAILVGVGDYNGEADLLGPPNDVATLRSVLEVRGASVSTLLNSQVTRPALHSLIESVTRTLEDGNPLILYFSGHTGKDADGRSVFYLPTLQPLPLAPLIREVLQKHKESIIIIDGGFDLSEVPKEELGRGAVLSADPSGRGLATEQELEGKSMGTFTWAFIRALRSSPTGIGLSIGSAFTTTSAILQQEKADPAPSIALGPNAPRI